MNKNRLLSRISNVKPCVSLAISITMISFLLGGMFTSCRDEMEEMFIEDYSGNLLSRASADVSNSSTLEQDPKSGYWKANGRVPLVGMGRIVDNMQGSLLKVGALGDASAVGNPERMVDLDLMNTFIPDQEVLGLKTPTHIVSIRDLNHIYAAGQKAGFVCKKASAGVLSVDVLKGYWLSTYLKGKKTGDSLSFSHATTLVDLGIGNIASHKENEVFCIEGNFTKPFDEIRLGNTGIKVGLLNADLEIYYAYVGENPIIPAINNGPDSYFKDKVTEGGFHNGEKRLIDTDLGNGISTGITLVYNATRMKVNFGRKIPAGSEVGFAATDGSLLDISAIKTFYVQTWNDGKEVTDDRQNMAQVLGIKLIGGGKKHFSLITTKECDAVELFYGGGGVKLSNITFHYAYVREPVKLDPSSYFTIANGAYYTPTCRFANPYKGGSVNFSLNQASANPNAEITQDGEYGYFLQPMDKTGNYYIRGKYTIPETGTMVEQNAVVVRNKNFYGGSIPVINRGSDTYTVSVPNNDFKGVIIIGGGSVAPSGGDKQEVVPSKEDTLQQSMNALVDSDLNNSLDFGKIEVGVIKDEAIVSVKIDNGKTINPNNKQLRVGFVMDKGAGLLSVDALKFLRVRLLKNGAVVNTKRVPLQNQGVGLSLIGKESGKIRVGVVTSEDFDEIQLFSTGLANITLNKFSVYYAFKEEITADSSNADDEFIQLISNANYGAHFKTSGAGLAELVKVSSNLGNAVDGDKESYATIGGFLGVANATSIEVFFDRVKENTEMGIIVSNLDPIKLELIKVLKLDAYDGDTKVASSDADGGLLNLKVLGFGNKVYYSIVPSKPCNKLVLKSGGVAGIDLAMHLHGAFIRPHVPSIDDNVNTDITRLDMISDHVCQGTVNGIIPTGGEEIKKYRLTITDENGTSKLDQKVGLKIDPVNGVKKFDIPNDNEFWKKLEPGKYEVICTDESPSEERNKTSKTNFTVHPLETSWKGDTDDWNTWNNWTNGTPWKCTNVILPNKGCSVYPKLTSEVYCNNIHFEDGAQLLGQSYLRYGGAVTIDKTVKGGEYRLMSSPLTGTLTGDMFILKPSEQSAWNTWRTQTEVLDYHNDKVKHVNYFTPVGVETEKSNYAEQRIEPVVYQRFWSRTVENYYMSRAAAPEGMEADWSATFNTVSTPYEAGTGFGIRFGEDKDANEYKLHFPKKHKDYHYFSPSGELLSKVTVRSDADLKIGGKLITVTSFALNRDKKGEWFLFGNPYMAAIDVQQFLKLNGISSAYLYVNGQYEVITCGGGTSASGTSAYLSPMSAMFIKVSDSVATVEVSEEMQCQMQNTQIPIAKGAIYLEALCEGYTSSCMLQRVSNGNDEYCEGADACLLTDMQDKSQMTVYTSKGNRQLAVQQMSDLNVIPVGFNLKNEGGEVTVSFKGNLDSWKGWMFVDRKTGNKYQLKGTISLKNVSSGSSRFSLQREKSF